MSAKQLAKGVTSIIWKRTHDLVVCKRVHDRIMAEFEEWEQYNPLDERWLRSVNEWYVAAVYGVAV